MNITMVNDIITLRTRDLVLTIQEDKTEEEPAVILYRHSKNDPYDKYVFAMISKRGITVIDNKGVNHETNRP